MHGYIAHERPDGLPRPRAVLIPNRHSLIHLLAREPNIANPRLARGATIEDSWKHSRSRTRRNRRSVPEEPQDRIGAHGGWYTPAKGADEASFSLRFPSVRL